MKETKDVTCMVVDYGIFVELARELGRSFKKVYYTNPHWASSYPKMNQAYIGKGFEEIETTLSPFDHFDEVDLYVFPDVGLGQMQLHLQSLGKAVWGSRKGEDLEFERDLCKKIMASKGLAVGPYRKIRGMDEVRKYLQVNKNQFLKINKWRGTFETLYAKNIQYIEPKLDEIEYKLGALKNEADFVVEKALPDKYEGGIDHYVVDGQYPQTLLHGCEIKDLGYLGVFTDRSNIAPEFKKFDETMAPVFKQYGMRSWLSTEVRVGKDKVPYMIDFTARAPAPPNELYQALYSNFADIVWQGANGTLVEPKPVAKWGAEIIMNSTWATNNWQPIEYPKASDKFVKLRYAVRLNGRSYIMPQTCGTPEIGSIVGYGNTKEEALNMVTEISKSIEGYDVIIPDEALVRAEEAIANAKEYGVWVKNEPK